MYFSFKSRTSATVLFLVFSVMLAGSQNLNIDELIECSRIKDQILLLELLEEKGFQKEFLEDGSTAFVSDKNLTACPEQVNIGNRKPGGSISIFTCDDQYFETLTSELRSHLLGFQPTDRKPHTFREAEVVSYRSAKFPDLVIKITDARVFENESGGNSHEFRRFELEIINFSDLH